MSLWLVVIMEFHKHMQISTCIYMFLQLGVTNYHCNICALILPIEYIMLCIMSLHVLPDMNVST